MILRASLFSPDLTHGFTTRHGGASEGVYRSLNMGRKWGDDPDAVAENYRRVAEAAGVSREGFVQVRQVHGHAVIDASRVEAGSEADGIFDVRARGRGRAVAVLTADCVPILLADEGGNVVAAVHSGWRGTVAGIATHAVQSLVSAGVRAEHLRAAIGPCIERAAFEVGDEVAERFADKYVHRGTDSKAHVDLVAAVSDQLVEAGLPMSGIERVGGCTHADAEQFFSYRRDAYGQPTKTGQHLSFIGWPAG